MKLMLSVTTLSIGLLFCTLLLAQELSIGKYSGSYQPSMGGKNYSLELNITRFENNAVEASVLRYGVSCSGEYKLKGSYKESKLTLRSIADGGNAGDCKTNLSLSLDGNKLVGKLGAWPIELHKK